MASVSFTEREYQALAGVIMDLHKNGEVEDAETLDRLAQKMNTSLARSTMRGVPNPTEVGSFEAPSPLDTLRKLESKLPAVATA